MKPGWLIREFRAQPLRLDPPLVGLLAVLMAFGLVVLYSAGDADAGLVWRQAVRLGLGVAVMIAASQIPPAMYRRWSIWVYLAGLALLVAALFIGVGRGASRWLDVGLFRFQPSEIMKIAVPLMLASWLYRKPLPPRLLDVAVCIAFLAAPMVLIALQPDLGTAMLVAAGGGMVLFLSGIRWRWLLLALGAVAAAAPLLWGVLHDYQRNRILTFVNPESDPLGQGWNIIQSKIAVGSGGLTGRGWLDSTQSRLEFLPEPHTDFILSVLAEEFGFIGVTVLFVLYALIMLRAIWLAAQARDTFGRMLGASLVFLFFVYLLVNAGMVSGAMPVVGVPLPLISYGGTSAATLLAGFGIIMGLYSRRKMLKA
ncbi:MAG: rod shape-determining protein RodA [Wenzhouxiangellaceae bacterium]|nr:rod shape-determining protein RodA [Wenzhouxiangellaceae bacterium]